MNKKYIIIATLGIGIVAIGIAAVLTSSQDVPNEVLLEQASGTSDEQIEPVQDNGQGTENISSEVSLTSIEVSLPDFDVMRYEGQNVLYLASTRTGEIYSSPLMEDLGYDIQVFNTETPRELVVQLPETDLDYIFLTTQRHMERHVVYKKDGEFYRYDVDQDRVEELPEDIGYAIADPSDNRLYYITSTNPTEIRSLRINTTQTVTHVTRTGIEWFSVAGGNIMYRTQSAIYRYSLSEKVDRLIEESTEPVSVSISDQVPRALLDLDEEILLFDTTNDVVQSVEADWNLRTVFWQRNAIMTHTIQNSEYIVGDFKSDSSIQRYPVDRESLEGIDPQHVFVTEDGTMVFLDRENFSIVVYPYYDRETSVEADPRQF